jgi:hypothetical protein
MDFFVSCCDLADASSDYQRDFLSRESRAGFLKIRRQIPMNPFRRP